MSKIVFITPPSIKLAKTFFNIIKIIGPASSPKIPQTLNPVYIAIKVKIGCTPICLLTSLGSKNCLAVDIIINKTIIAIPKTTSPFSPQIIAHGTMTGPEPNIGSASTKPINIAISNGYSTFSPTILNKYNPISDITKDTSIKVASAFKYPTNVFLKSYKWVNSGR